MGWEHSACDGRVIVLARQTRRARASEIKSEVRIDLNLPVAICRRRALVRRRFCFRRGHSTCASTLLHFIWKDKACARVRDMHHISAYTMRQLSNGSVPILVGIVDFHTHTQGPLSNETRLCVFVLVVFFWVVHLLSTSSWSVELTRAISLAFCVRAATKNWEVEIDGRLLRDVRIRRIYNIAFQSSDACWDVSASRNNRWNRRNAAETCRSWVANRATTPLVRPFKERVPLWFVYERKYWAGQII